MPDPNEIDPQAPTPDEFAPVGPGAVVPLAGSFTNTATPIENPQFTQAAANSGAADVEATRAAEAAAAFGGKVTEAKAAGAGVLSDLEKMQVEQQRNLGDIYDQRHAAVMAEHNQACRRGRRARPRPRRGKPQAHTRRAFGMGSRSGTR